MNELQRNRATDRIGMWTKHQGMKKGCQVSLLETVRESFTEEVTLDLGLEREGGGSRQMW